MWARDTRENGTPVNGMKENDMRGRGTTAHDKRVHGSLRHKTLFFQHFLFLPMPLPPFRGI